VLVFYLAALDSDDDKNKFEYIYRKYYRFMLHTAAGIIKNPTLAEDAVHETFVQLLRGIDTLRIDNERALKSYLYMVTRERSIDFLRKWERRRGAWGGLYIDEKKLFVRHKFNFDIHPHPCGKALQGAQRRVCIPSFQFADIGLCNAGALRKLFLCQTAFLPGIDHSLRNGKLRLKSIPFCLKRRPL